MRRRRWSFDPWRETLELGFEVVGEYDVLVDDFENGGDEVFSAFLPMVCVYFLFFCSLFGGAWMI